MAISSGCPSTFIGVLFNIDSLILFAFFSGIVFQIKKYPNPIKNLVPYRIDQIWHADISYTNTILFIIISNIIRE